MFNLTERSRQSRILLHPIQHDDETLTGGARSGLLAARDATYKYNDVEDNPVTFDAQCDLAAVLLNTKPLTLRFATFAMSESGQDQSIPTITSEALITA